MKSFWWRYTFLWWRCTIVITMYYIMYHWGQRGQTPAFYIRSPSSEILLIPQWNPSYIANFKLVKKVVLTLPTLFVLKPILWKWNSNQGRKETWLDSPFYQFKGRKETWLDSPFIGGINPPPLKNTTPIFLAKAPLKSANYPRPPF